MFFHLFECVAINVSIRFFVPIRCYRCLLRIFKRNNFLLTDHTYFFVRRICVLNLINKQLIKTTTRCTLVGLLLVIACSLIWCSGNLPDYQQSTYRSTVLKRLSETAASSPSPPAANRQRSLRAGGAGHISTRKTPVLATPFKYAVYPRQRG